MQEYNQKTTSCWVPYCKDTHHRQAAQPILTQIDYTVLAICLCLSRRPKLFPNPNQSVWEWLQPFPVWPQLLGVLHAQTLGNQLVTATTWSHCEKHSVRSLSNHRFFLGTRKLSSCFHYSMTETYHNFLPAILMNFMLQIYYYYCTGNICRSTMDHMVVQYPSFLIFIFQLIFDFTCSTCSTPNKLETR